MVRNIKGQQGSSTVISPCYPAWWPAFDPWLNRKNQLPQVVLWRKCTCSNTRTHIDKCKNSLRKRKNKVSSCSDRYINYRFWSIANVRNKFGLQGKKPASDQSVYTKQYSWSRGCTQILGDSQRQEMHWCFILIQVVAVSFPHRLELTSRSI